MESVLVADAFEGTSLSDKPSVGLLHVSLLVHDLGDFFTHHLGHLLTHIIL